MNISATTYVGRMQPRISSQMKQRRSGYEPSDTETEWQESPWNDADKEDQELNDAGLVNVLQDQARNKSPLRFNKRNAGKIEYDDSSPTRASMASPAPRRHSKSPYAPQRDDGPNAHSALHHRNFSNRPVSPFSKSERRRHVSPYKTAMEDHHLGNGEILISNRKYRQANNDVTKVSDILSYSRRFASAPRQRLKEKDLVKKEDYWEQNITDRKVSPLKRNLSRKERDGSHNNASSGGEINEMLANVKIDRAPTDQVLNLESTDSIAPGDIFFSRDYGVFTKQNNIFATDGESKFREKPEFITDLNPSSHQRNQENSRLNHNIREISATGVSVSTQTTGNSNFGVSSQSSNVSDLSGRTNGTARNFVANRQKSRKEAWFSCIKKGSCRASKRSPEKERGFYEASVIEKASVIESLRQFWADKHRPTSLSEFTCHKQEALHLKQLVSVSCQELNDQKFFLSVAHLMLHRMKIFS